MNDNENIEINLDDDNENIDIDREDSIYTNISEEEINEIRSRIEANEDNIVVLQNESGNKVALSINSNYVMTLKLLNKANEILSTGTIDLPIESMVVNASYRNGILTLTLQNGQTLDVDISDIVSGLVSETTFNSAISRLEGLISGLDTRMTTAEEDIDTLENDVSDIKTEQTQQNTNIQTNRTNIATNTQDIANIKAEQITQNNRIQINETDISTIKQEQTTQNTKIQKNETDIATNKASIETIQAEQVEQNENIQENADSIAELEQKHDTEVAELNEKIADLQEQVDMAGDLIPTGDESGSDITVNDSAWYRFKKVAIEGKSEQETRNGYNKINLNNLSNQSKNGINLTVNKEEGSITLNGTSTSATNFEILLNEIIPIGNIVSMGANNSESNSGVYVRLMSSTGTETSNIRLNSANEKKENIILSDDVKSIYIRILSSIQLSNFKIYPQLELGASLHDFEIYGVSPSPEYESPIQNVTGNIKVKVENKNKYYSPTTGNKTINNVTLNYENNSSEITINGTATATISDSFSIKPISLEAGTYTASIKGLNVISSNADRIFLKNNDTSNIIVNSIKDVTPQTFTLTETTNVVPVFIIASGSSYSNKIIQIQIEEGSTATEYIAHEEQTVTFPLSEGQVFHESDTIEDKIVQRRNTVVFNGTEAWIRNTNYQNILGLYLGLGSYLQPKEINVKCNVAKFNINAGANNQTIFNICKISNSFTNFIIDLDILKFPDVASWKAYLAQQYANGTPVTLEYELATPIEIPFTEAQRTAKAQIDKLYSYKGTTHITSNANLDVTYRKDPNLAEEQQNSKLEELEARLELLEG